MKGLILINTKFYDGTRDEVFKAIFLNKENNYYMLKTLIERCLKKKIELIKVISPELLKENIYEKGKTVDVFAKIDDEICFIEMNSNYYNGLHQRNASYIFKQYSTETDVGEDYTSMPNIMQINFTCGLPNNYPTLGIYKLVDNKTNIKYIDNFTIYEYNIDKVKDEYQKGNKEYKFLAMLKSRPEELIEICEGDKFMEEFKKKVEKLNEDHEFIEYMSQEEDMKKLRNTWKKHYKNEGMKEGIEQEKLDIAKNMLKEELDISLISKLTGLTENQIKDL